MQLKLINKNLGHDLNSNPIDLKALQFQFSRPGPKVYMQASVHAAELQGNAVIDQLIQYIQCRPDDFCGEIILVPLANPWGVHFQMGCGTYGRFDPVTGTNWNRSYHDLSSTSESDQVQKLIKQFIDQKIDEQSFIDLYKLELTNTLNKIREGFSSYGATRDKWLTLSLQELSVDADIFLDLHTAPRAHEYLYCPQYLKEDARELGFQVNLVIPEDFAGAGDEAHFAPWSALYKKFEEQNREIKSLVKSYTLELGSEEVFSQELAKRQSLKLLHYLFHHKSLLIEPKDKKDKKELQPQFWGDLKDFKTYHAPSGGLCEYLCAPGALVKKEEVLAHIKSFDPETKGFQVKTMKAIKDAIIVNHFSTCNVALGTELFQVLENYQSY